MTNRTEQITQIKAAIKAIEAQRSILGDAAVDLSLQALQLQLQIAELDMPPSAFPQSEGERCQATILFSDLSGYTELNEKLDPEEVQELMNRIKAKAIRIVEHHEGIVNQFVGDEILALFGIPNAHEDDPIRAVCAALELHRTVLEISKEVEPLIGRVLTLHSGINTGLIVTTMWDEREGKFGVTGDSVNTGARLLSQAKGNEILVSPETHRLISPYFKVEAMEPVKLKGKAEPMIPFRILGKTKIKTRIEAAEQRGFTNFIGRDDELAKLHICLEKTIQGEGQFVTVTGDAGLGKSRLIYEFRHSLDRKIITVVQGRCQSYGISTPYLPFLDALRRGLHLNEEDSSAEMHEKVVTNITSIDPALKQYIPVFLHLLSIPSRQYPLPRELTGDKLKQTIQEALVSINTLNTKRQPMVLILEDWHWADEASDATLLKHFEMMTSYRLMVVVLHRPEYSPKWNQLPFHTLINLVSVNERNVESMIKAIYGVEFLPKKLTSQIYQRSDGNPFFIEELCDLLKEEETVLIKEGKLSLHHPLEQITFPETVQAVVRAKMDRLESVPREVIRLASVIGREFLQRILEQITSRKEELSYSLEYLKVSDLIHQIEDLPELTFQFNHVITQEVTYQTLLIKQRTLLHRLVGETIEVLYAERLEEQFEVLAYHYSKSDEEGKAIYYLELAGDKAARNFSLLDARTYYREAMELIDTNSKTKKLRRKRIVISLKWAKISHYAGPDEFVEVLETSMEYANELNNKPEIAHLNYWLGQRSVLTGNLKQAIEYFSSCIDLAEQWNEKALLAQAYTAIGRIYFFDAEYLLANHCLEKGFTILEELGENNDVAYAAGFLCGSYAYSGDFKKALAYGERAIKIAEKSGDLSRKANSLTWLGLCYFFQGTWEKCIEAYSQAIEIARPIGDHVAIINSLPWLGSSLFMSGNKEEGLLKMQEGIEMMERGKIYLLYPALYPNLGYCYAKATMMKKAKAAANKGLEWSTKGMKGFECLAYYTLSIAESQNNDSNTQLVDETIEKGLDSCRVRGQLPYLARGYFEYAQILFNRKDQQKAKNFLSKAIELFSEMNMPWWLEQAREFEKSVG